MNKNSEEKIPKVQISWLACIYGDYHLNPYIMEIFNN